MNKHIKYILIVLFLAGHQLAYSHIWKHTTGEAIESTVDIMPPVTPSDLTASAISSTAVELTWTDNSTDETGFRVERSLSSDSGFESFAILPANATYLVNHGLSSATTYFYRVSAFNDTGDSADSNVASSTTNSNESELPYYWSSMDVGNPDLEGSSTFNNGFFETEGNGRLDANSNDFHFVYQPLQGDGEIVAQLTNMRQAHWDHQGVMIKETLDPESLYAMTELYRDKNAAVFKGRNDAGFIYLEDSSKNFNIPLRLKMERTGDTFIASVANNGIDWQEIHRETIIMGENAFVGLVSHASVNDKISPATWRDVAVSNGASTIAAPTNLTVEASATDEAILNWVDNSVNETGFRIERAIKGDTIIFEDLVEVGPDLTSYTDDGLALGGTYFYRVRAVVDNLASFPSTEEDVKILEVQNTILHLQRLAGDYDRTSLNNTVTVLADADTVNNTFRHPGMLGKQIDVSLSTTFSSLDGTLSLKLMPNTQNQTVEFFTSGLLNISQVQDQLLITVNGVENSYNVTLDSVTCNHVLLRFNNGVMSTYADGTWFDDVNVGTFSINSFSLGEFNGNLWDIQLVNSQISDEIVQKLSARCTNEVEPLVLPFGEGRPFRHCGPYTCLWLTNESQLLEERKRAYLKALDIAFDKNTFDIGMYLQPDIDEWVNLERDLISEGFDYFTLSSLFTRNQSNTAYWLHENFHGYQVPLKKGGKWLAEASANWAGWNFYKENLRGISRYTLDPHLAIFESQAGEPFARFYHSSILLSYITYFVSDEAFMGRLYNTPAVEANAVVAIRNLLAEEGHDLDEVFAEFAARTVVWDYPDPNISDDFAANERSSINAGEIDNRFVDVLTETGTYGVLTPALEAFLPGAFYAWNTYKIESTTASIYTVNLIGSTDNAQGTEFVGKVVTGTPGSYEYHDISVSRAVALGTGEAQTEVEVSAGEELYLVVVTTSDLSTNGSRVNYSYAIESSAHTLPNDHILTFTLEEENRRVIIDHENFTISAEVVRGTDPTSLTPVITLSEGATSDPAVGESVDFTNSVTYIVTGQGNSTPKNWTVSVAVVPPRTGTDILTFELQDLVPFSTINDEEHTVSVNLVDDLDLTNVIPVFTLSDGASSNPASGEAIDLSSPVTYTITAEDRATNQEWTVSADNFAPFITTWQTAINNEDISLSFDGDLIYDFSYVWKDANGSELSSGTFSNETDGNTLTKTFSTAGSYTLEIKGEYPLFTNYPSSNLKDVNQWGDIPWKNMRLSFSGWEGETFSATDQPDLSDVGSMFGMFRNARSFNADLSKWDVSNVASMADMFSGASAFNGDISQWNVSSVTSMDEMFREANAFNADISGWDVSNLNNMDRMLFSTRSFNHSLGDWNIGSVSSMFEALRSSGLSRLNYDRTLIGWANQNVREDVILGVDGLAFCDAEEDRSFLINEKGWNITGDALECPEDGEANILFFALDEQTSPAILDYINHTINVEVATGITALNPSLILSKGATSSPSSEEEVNFTEPVTYTVTALDGTPQEWIVTVKTMEIPLNTEGSEELLYVYPNPVKDVLHLETVQESTAYLVDLQGRQVLPSKSGASLLFNLEALESGLYLLIIKFDNKTVTRKVLKEN